MIKKAAQPNKLDQQAETFVSSNFIWTEIVEPMLLRNNVVIESNIIMLLITPNLKHTFVLIVILLLVGSSVGEKKMKLAKFETG